MSKSDKLNTGLVIIVALALLAFFWSRIPEPEKESFPVRKLSGDRTEWSDGSITDKQDTSMYKESKQ